MAYTTITKIRERLPLITETVRGDSILEGFIGQCDAVIDSYLGRLYELPLTDPPDPIIEHIALDLACGLVLENVFGEDSPNDVRQSSILKQRSLDLLEMISAGAIPLTCGRPNAEAVPRVSRIPLTSKVGSDFALYEDELSSVE